MMNQYVQGIHFPIMHPVHIFAIISLIILLAPIVLTKLKLPGTVGLILAGVIVGPNGLHIIDKDSSVILFGTVGILYIMFLSGLEVDFIEFKRSGRKSLLFGALTFLLPQVIGTWIAIYLLDFPVKTSILLASMYASHTLLAYPIASRLGITKDESVLVAIGGTLITNTISLSILAVITSSVKGTLDTMFWVLLVASFAAFSTFMFVLIPRFARWFFCNVESEGISQFMFILALVFVSASIAHWAGIEPIIGAFLAGLAVSRLVPDGSALLSRIHFVGHAIFIPYFLIYVGMLVDLRVLLNGPQALIVAAAMTLTAVMTKWAAAFVTQKACGFSSHQRGVIFGLSNAQAANTLAAVMVGYQLKIFDDNIMNGTIVMILVTCVISALAVERSGIRLAMTRKVDSEATRSGAPQNAFQRILVPIANVHAIGRLMDFAFAIKNASVPDPVYPLTVILDAEDASARVAEAERLLSDVRTHASAGTYPVKLISRIDISATGGMLRVIRELNISCVVIGWSGESVTKEYLFGSLHAHLLEQSGCMVFVNGMRAPINTTKRLVTILPPHSEFEHGIRDCLQDLQHLRRILKIPGVFQGTAVTLEAIKDSFPELIKDASCIPYDAWEDMPFVCQREMKSYDLTVFVNARKGGVSWNEDVEKFARKIRRLAQDASLVLLYAPAKDVMVSSSLDILT